MRGARETTSRAPSLHSRPGSGSAGAQRHSPHPIQDRTDAELHALADSALAEILEQLTE